MKRSIALLLSVLLCFNLLCVSALATGARQDLPPLEELPAVLLIDTDGTVDGSRVPAGLSSALMFGTRTASGYDIPTKVELEDGKLSMDPEFNDYKNQKERFTNSLIGKIGGLVILSGGEYVPVVFLEDHDTEEYIAKARNENGHDLQCKWCGKAGDTGVKHACNTWESTGSNDGHKGVCSVCSYPMTAPHTGDGFCDDCSYLEKATLHFTVDGKTVDKTYDCGTTLSLAEIESQFEKPEGYTRIKWIPALADGTTVTLSMDGSSYSGEWDSNPYTVDVVVTPKSGGTASVDKTSAKPGEKVTVTISPKSNYEVSDVKADGVTDMTGSGNTRTFTMPAANVTVNVTLKKASGNGGGGGGTVVAEKYRVIVNCGIGGTATATPTKQSAGEEVNITVKANKNYVIMAAYLNGEPVDDEPGQNAETWTFTFPMPEGNATVDVLFKLKEGVDIAVKDEMTNEDVTINGNVPNDLKVIIQESEVTLPKKEAGDLALKASTNSKLISEALEYFKDIDPKATKDDITIVAKPLLTITPKPYNNKQLVIKMDIQGMIQLYAQLKTTDSDSPLMKQLTGSGSSKKMTESVTLTVSLPLDFIDQPVFVAHKGYQYDTEADGNKFTFTNPHGFSEFEFGTDDKAVAANDRYTDFKYLTLAKAAEEAERYDTITLYKNTSENVKLPYGVVVKPNGYTFSGTINSQRPKLMYNGTDYYYYVDTDGGSGGSSGSGSGSANGANGKPSVVPGSGGTTPSEPGNPRSRFLDVAYGAFYFDAVEWAAENGITTGKPGGVFAPNDSCTRAEMVTFLWRAAGSPEPSGNSSAFTDVVSGSYYEKAVAWAVEKGVTNGVSATSFAPNATVTRDQTVTFIYRSKGSPAASGSSFSDVPANAYYANAVAWAVQAGVTNGTSATTFSPAKNCTRGEIVTFLYRSK